MKTMRLSTISVVLVSLFVILVCYCGQSDAAVNKLIFPPTEETDEIAGAKWKVMEKKMKEGVEGLIRKVLPMVVGASSEVEISPECTSDIFKIIVGVRQMKLWAFKLLDAMGIPGGGILQGQFGFYGNHGECLDVIFPGDPEDRSTGQYCLLDLTPPLVPKTRNIERFSDIFSKINITFDTEIVEELRKQSFIFYDGALRVGACLPSRCTTEDISNIAKSAVSGLEFNAVVYSCETKQPIRIDTTQAVVIGIFTLIVALNIVAGLTEAFTNKLTTIENEKHNQKETVILPLWKRLLFSFSPLKHLSNTMSTQSNVKENTLESMNGIRAISMSWVILGHSYICVDYQMLRNVMRLDDYRKEWSFQPILMGFIAVDSFFVLTGILLAYIMVSSLDQKGFRFFNAPLLIVRRIWRLLPSVMLVVGITVIYPLMGSGPLWKDVMDQFDKNCRERWWAIPLFINNFYKFENMCLPHSWYVSSELQCFLLMLVYFVLLYKKPMVAYIYLGFLIAVSVVTSGIVTYVLDLHPTELMGKTDYEYFLRFSNVMYSTTYCHIGVYAIGVGFGTFMARNKGITVTKKFLLLGWLLVAFSGLAVMYCITPWNAGGTPSAFESVLYASTHRNVWALCLAWVIFVCAIGKGGLINEFLSWGGFLPVARLSYMMYLIHILIIYSYGASRNGPLDYAHSTYAWLFSGNMVICFLAALGLRVLFEAPLASIEGVAMSYIIPNNRIKNKKEPEVPKIENNNVISAPITTMSLPAISTKPEKEIQKVDVKPEAEVVSMVNGNVATTIQAKEKQSSTNL